MAAFVSAAEAAARVRDQATVVLSGNTYRLVAESVLTAIEARFLETGRPARLQVIYPIMAERARAGKSRPTDVSGATFTISNLGMHRVDAFTAVINPPQAAILAVGSVVDRVVPIDGAPAVRPTLTMTLSSDHRVVDGARAAAFMDDLAAAIGDPFTWLK